MLCLTSLYHISNVVEQSWRNRMVFKFSGLDGYSTSWRGQGISWSLITKIHFSPPFLPKARSTWVSVPKRWAYWWVISCTKTSRKKCQHGSQQVQKLTFRTCQKVHYVSLSCQVTWSTRVMFLNHRNYLFSTTWVEKNPKKLSARLLYDPKRGFTR